MRPLHHTHRRPTLRSAFTLLELLLVLAVIVAVAAMAAPSFKSVLDTQRLKSAGDHVRSEWAKSKNRAMRSGRIYVFRYQPGGDAYYVQPWYSEDDMLESSDAGFGGAFVDPFRVPDQLATLPEGVVFLDGDMFAETRDLDVEQDMAMAGLAGGWSRPILFYPDGTSSSARVVLQNRRLEMLSVTLRGLTGIATVSDTTSVDSWLP